MPDLQILFRYIILLLTRLFFRQVGPTPGSPYVDDPMIRVRLNATRARCTMCPSPPGVSILLRAVPRDDHSNSETAEDGR